MILQKFISDLSLFEAAVKNCSFFLDSHIMSDCRIKVQFELQEDQGGDNVFRIGDLLRLARVSIMMLRYYDVFGILKPYYTDEITGYRFYSVSQIPRLNRIQILKEMGFSLSEIAELLKKDSTSFLTEIYMPVIKRKV